MRNEINPSEERIRHQSKTIQSEIDIKPTRMKSNSCPIMSLRVKFFLEKMADHSIVCDEKNIKKIEEEFRNSLELS